MYPCLFVWRNGMWFQTKASINEWESGGGTGGEESYTVQVPTDSSTKCICMMVLGNSALGERWEKRKR